MFTVTISDRLSPDAVESLKAGLPPDAELDEQWLSLNSVDPPTFIQLVADAATWHLVLKAAVTIFLSEIAKSAASDVWKNKAVIGKALSNVLTAPIRKIASALRDAKTKSRDSTQISIGIPLPFDP
jgi:hypothetical protein